MKLIGFCFKTKSIVLKEKGTSFVNIIAEVKKRFLTPNSVIRELLNMFGIIWKYKSTFPTVHSMKYKYRSSSSDENLASKLRGAVSIKYIVDFEDLVKKK